MQLRDRSLLNKRKHAHGYQNTDLAPVCEKPIEDQSKTSRANKKFIRQSVDSLTTSVGTKPDRKLRANGRSSLTTTIDAQPGRSLRSNKRATLNLSVDTQPARRLRAKRRASLTTSDDNQPDRRLRAKRRASLTTSDDNQPGDRRLRAKRRASLTTSDDNQPSDRRLRAKRRVSLTTTVDTQTDRSLRAKRRASLTTSVDTQPDRSLRANRKFSQSVALTITVATEPDLDFVPDDSLQVSCTNVPVTSRSHDYESKEMDCSTTYISDDSSPFPSHILDIEPITMLYPLDGVDISSEAPELEEHDTLDLHCSAIEFGDETLGASSCINSHPVDVLANEFVDQTIRSHSDDKSTELYDSSNSFPIQGISKQSRRYEVQVPDTGLPQKQHESFGRHGHVHELSLDLSISMKNETLVSVEHTKADEVKNSPRTLDETKSNGLNYQSSHMKDELLGGAKITSTSPNIRGYTDYCTENQRETLSAPEPCPLHQKIRSTRRVISPSSQEIMCFTKNLEDSCSDMNQYRCKASPQKAHIPPGKVIMNKGGIQFIQRSGIRQVISKPSYKGYRQGLRSRNYRNLSSSRIHESAIVFSQHQMHDIENVAVKLMKELDSMKSMVEQKITFQSNITGSLAKDTDEVRTAIMNATRATEVAQKCLKTMSRDCKRFCKIMEMTQPTSVVPKFSVGSRLKKVSFADEAGGELCHVQFFEKDL